jgi:alpha-1,3-mannosyltransferase
MHVLLYLPAVLLSLNFHFGIIKTLLSVVFIVVMQLIIGLEWILHKPESYFGRVFEFGRDFWFRESRNWQFLGQELATSKAFANFLLASNLVLLLAFLFGKWTSPSRGLGAWLKELRLHEIGNTPAKPLNPRFVAQTIFACNMVGILCARSLHPQFYAWYH